MPESVMVVKRAYLEKYIGGRNGLITENAAEIADIVTERHEFLPRPEAENDPSYKQIIPYVAIVRGDEVFSTTRLGKGGEARLHGLMALGVGGHINPADDVRSDALMNGLRREVAEEVGIERELGLTPRGVINDDGNAVGSVHLGFLFTMEVEGGVEIRETEKLEGRWIRKTELFKLFDSMESWAAIAAPALM